MATGSGQNSIEKLMAILYVHTEPEVLGIEVKEAVEAVECDSSRLKKYLEAVRNVRYAWKKVGRYEIYFSDFYPNSSEITNVEALTHHVHAYLEDLSTLKNKLTNLLGILKNEAAKKASNADEIKSALIELIAKIEDGFKTSGALRNQHRHGGMRYVHDDLLKAENACMMLEQLDNPLFSSFYDDVVKDQMRNKFTQDVSEFFERARSSWVEVAKRNREQLDEQTNKLFDGLAHTIFQLLGIESTAAALQALSDRAYEKK